MNVHSWNKTENLHYWWHLSFFNPRAKCLQSKQQCKPEYSKYHSKLWILYLNTYHILYGMNCLDLYVGGVMNWPVSPDKNQGLYLEFCPYQGLTLLNMVRIGAKSKSHMYCNPISVAIGNDIVFMLAVF